MLSCEEIKAKLEAAIHGCSVVVIKNDAPAAQHSLLIDNAHGVAIARFLRDDAELQMDYCSNVSGVDWLDAVLKDKVKKKTVVDGVEKEVEETIETKRPGFLEVVYHLYSMKKKHGPIILRMRTANRTDAVTVPSFTPIWRAAEFQEREVFDLYGVKFEGHPDLRRLLMWDEFEDHPMRKDYVDPDDFEYEPTPHDEVLERAREHAGVKPPEKK